MTSPHNLSWHSLDLTLVNTRMAKGTIAHPFSIIEAILKGAAFKANLPKQPVFHIKNRRHSQNKFRLGEHIPIEAIFTNIPKDKIHEFRQELINYLDDPETGKNFDILQINVPEIVNLEKLITKNNFNNIISKETDKNHEICLEFQTPFSFKPEKAKQRTFISKEQFLAILENNLSKAFNLTVKYEGNSDKFTMLPYFWNYTEIKHPSNSQPGNTQFIKGCVGKLYIKGAVAELFPLLVVGSAIHIGLKTTNSQGYYILHPESAPFFEKFFPDKKAILSSLKIVIQRYDNAMVSLTMKNSMQFDENKYAEEIYKDLKSNSNIFQPNNAFLIKKKNKSHKLVEELNFKDIIIQQYFLRIISNFFDNMFEESSIGFRKGMSRERVIELVQAGITEGYEYVVESDIEDFFPSVDHDILEQKLRNCLPSKDEILISLIITSFKNSYKLNGKLCERKKGLAQGSPLSPILANFYLDSFDEEIKKSNVKMIRYADDFIILTRTKEEAEKILAGTSDYLFSLGLSLKKEKTAIRKISEGFSFLGMNFNKNEVIVDSEDVIKQFRKPLYLTEPYLFISIDGDSVDIKKNSSIIESIPIRRISEIIVLEKATFGSSLLKKCVDFNIPLTITLDTGYYITTIKPDSKTYYEISYLHTLKYNSLSDIDILSIAKEFAATKIFNYLGIFKQRYNPYTGAFIKQLEKIIQNIYEADNIEIVRGFEGFAAKKIFAAANVFLDETEFHLKKRDRNKPDRMNSLLNFGFYLLFTRINATVRSLGLNPYLGFLHSSADRYESFVCDIQELFRARIHRFIIRLVNLKIIKKEDFEETERGFYLKREAVKRFLEEFETEMGKKTAKDKMSLKDSIYAQIYIMRDYFTKDAHFSFYRWNV
jgi:CRISPR-associated protein Cas1